jgi:hypothetical protein
VSGLERSARVPGRWCTLRSIVRWPGLAGVPPGATAVRHHRRHRCYGAAALGKMVGLGAVRSRQATGALGWAEEPPAARNSSPELTAVAPLPSVPDRGGPPVSAARGREPERAARTRRGPRLFLGRPNFE